MSNTEPISLPSTYHRVSAQLPKSGVMSHMALTAESSSSFHTRTAELFLMFTDDTDEALGAIFLQAMIDACTGDGAAAVDMLKVATAVLHKRYTIVPESE